MSFDGLEIKHNLFILIYIYNPVSLLKCLESNLFWHVSSDAFAWQNLWESNPFQNNRFWSVSNYKRILHILNSKLLRWFFLKKNLSAETKHNLLNKLLFHAKSLKKFDLLTKWTRNHQMHIHSDIDVDNVWS